MNIMGKRGGAPAKPVVNAGAAMGCGAIRKPDEIKARPIYSSFELM
jgi:hypothetical protein